MNIPKSFFLGAIPYKVTLVNHIDRGESLGITDQNIGEIKIMKGLPQERMQQVFCHELVHAMLFAAGKDKLAENEELVDVLGTFLHQFIVTQKGVAK